MQRYALILAFATWVAGCGTKGPLYLPPTAAPRPAPPPSAPPAQTDDSKTESDGAAR